MTEPPDAAPREKPAALLDEWISRAALGEQLSVSVDTLSRWETRRIGPPCVRVGRAVYYRIESVRSWLREQEPARSAAGGRR